MINSSRRRTALWCLLGTLSAAFSRVHAQSTSQPATAFTLAISRTILNGPPITLEFRGIAAGGAARLEVTGGSDARGFPAGGYLLVDDSSGAARVVDPTQKTVRAIGAGARLGGLVERYTPPGTVRDVVVTLDTAGAGEAIDGRPTRRYRITTHFSLGVASPTGEVGEAHSSSVTELWQAEGIEHIPNPFVGLGGNSAADNFLAPLDSALVAVARRLPGVTLRSETHTWLSAGGVTFSTQEVTTRLSALRPATVDAATLRVPPGFEVK